MASPGDDPPADKKTTPPRGNALRELLESLRRGEPAKPGPRGPEGEPRFTDDAEVFELLSALSVDPVDLAELRRTLAEESASDVARLRLDQLVRLARVRIARGELDLSPVAGPVPRWEDRVLTIPEEKAEAEFEPPAAAPPAKEEATTTDWIEIELVNASGRPMEGTRYLIEPSDGTKREGRLDGKGRARLDKIPPGNCDVSFPDTDGRDWEAA